MSYTIAYAEATCTINNLLTAPCYGYVYSDEIDLAISIADFLTNHEGEIPEALKGETHEDVVRSLAAYLELSGDKLSISYSTEADGNFDPELFNFLVNHIAHLQSSPYMEVSWGVDDSREGSSCGTEYIDREGETIDIDAAIKAYINSKH